MEHKDTKTDWLLITNVAFPFPIYGHSVFVFGCQFMFSPFTLR